MIGRGTVRVVRILGRRRKKENLKGVNIAQCRPTLTARRVRVRVRVTPGFGLDHTSARTWFCSPSDARILENSMMHGFREVSGRNGANVLIHLCTSLVGKRLEGDAVGIRRWKEGKEMIVTVK